MPLRPDLLIARPRLLKALNESMRDARVAAIWAPAGSGKSALLSQWVATLDADVPVIDASDEAEAVEAIAAIDASAEGYLVVDQVDRAPAPVREALLAVLERGLPQVRIVMAGRFDPFPPSVSRRMSMRELREADLAFSAAEIERYLGDAERTLDTLQAERVRVRTGGWAAALVLLKQVLGTGDDDAVIDRFDGDSRPVADYLVSELLEQLPPLDRDVLVWAAVDARVPLVLAAALTDRADAGAVLDRAVSANSLMSRIDDVYVFHPVLATFLGAEQRRRNIVRAREGHRHASAWFERSGALVRALDHLVRAEDDDALAVFLDDHGYALIFHGESGAVMRAVRRLDPAHRRRIDADMRLVMDVPHFAERERAAHRLAARTASQPDSAPTAVDRIVDLLWSHATGRPDPAARDALSMTDTALLPPAVGLFLEIALAWTDPVVDDDDRLRASERLIAVGARSEAAGPHRWLRLLALESALSVVASASRWVDVEPVFRALAREMVSDADPADSVATRAVFARAAHAFHRGESLPATLARIADARQAVVEPAMQHMARTLTALDGVDRCPGATSLTVLTETIEDELADWPVALSYAAVPWMYSALWHGDIPLTDRILVRCERVLGVRSMEFLTVAFLRRPERDTERALSRALEKGATKVSPLAPAYAWTALALHADARGQESRATDRIVSALMCASPLGAVRPFLQESRRPAMIIRDRIDRLGRWRPLGDAVLAHDRVTSTALPQAALTPRERELVRELPAHQSIPDIAVRRQVSVNTVKTQLQSIYGKLGVTSRADAVTAARELGLL